MKLETLLAKLETNDRQAVGALPLDRDLPRDEAALLRHYLGAGLRLTADPALNTTIWAESTAGLRERLDRCESVAEGADILNWLVPWQVFREVTRPNRKALRTRFPDVHGALGLNDELGRRVVYRSTTEGYTLDPLATLDRGYGRCGELSVALTGLYRAKGLLARQVYVPYWAHQDDNHAWVEVKTDRWHFIGAAEPEVELDRGWFETAATRAPLVMARAVFRVPEQQYPRLVNGGFAVPHNAPYFVGRTLRLKLTRDGKPLGEQPVYVQILNEGRLRTALALLTDRDGTLELSLNAGDYRLSTARGDTLYEHLLSLEEDTELHWEITEDEIPEVRYLSGTQRAPQLQKRERVPRWPESLRTAHKKSCNESYERKQAKLRSELEQRIRNLALPEVPEDKAAAFKSGLLEMNRGAEMWLRELEGRSPEEQKELIQSFLALSPKERFYGRRFAAAPVQEERVPDHQGSLILQRLDPQNEELWHTVRQLPATKEALDALRDELRYDPHRYRLQTTYRKQNGDVLYAECCALGHALPESAELLEQLALDVPPLTRDLLRQPASAELLRYVTEGTGILVFHGEGETNFRLKAELAHLKERDLPLPIVEREEVPPETIVREAYLEPEAPPYIFYIVGGQLLKATQGFAVGTDQKILDLTRELFEAFEG